MTTFKNMIQRINGSGYLSVETVAEIVAHDPTAAFLGLCELSARQTVDEHIEKGTKHKNRFGFSKKHVTRGLELAEKFSNFDFLEEKDLEDAHKIAYNYRNQLLMIALGAVPVNSILVTDHQ